MGTSPSLPSSGDAPGGLSAGQAADSFTAYWTESPDPLLLVDEHGTIRDTNPLAARLGFATGQAFHGTFEDPDHAKLALERRLALNRGGLRLTSGSMVAVAVVPLPDPPGFRMVQLRDLTCVSSMNQSMDVLRPVATVGQLTASIANVINNPLAVILGRVELLTELGSAEPGALPTHLNVIAEHAQRIAGIIDALLSFARPADSTMEMLSVSELLQNARRGSGQRTADMRLDFRVDPALKLKGNRAKLEQVVSTLLAYAAEAMQRRGALRVEVKAGEGHCVISYTEGHVALPPRAREQIERGLDTREPPASGFVLAVHAVQGLLRACHGSLSIGSGAEPLFRVELPLDATRVPVPTPWRVLCVHAGDGLIEELREALRGRQALWVEARTNAEAMSVIGRNPPNFIVAGTGSSGSGLSLHNEIAMRWPGLEKRVALAVEVGGWSIPCTLTLTRPLCPSAVVAAIELVAQLG